MMLCEWDKLPKEMQTDEIRMYYDILKKKSVSLFFKRVFDVIVSSLLLLILLPFFVCLALVIKIDSRGPVFYRQERVTQYGKRFRIFKFRTMINNAEKMGSYVTVKEDKRVTRIGKVLRKYRLDELCQLIDVLRGKMTFVGTRPEVIKYVKEYTPEMVATLLLPAGVTSMASICYKDEADLLTNVVDVDTVYLESILPQKMKYNLEELKRFSFCRDIKVMFITIISIFGYDYKCEYNRSKK